MTRRIAAMRQQRGLSLIELMVTVLIGSLLILGLVEVFGASRMAYQLSQGLARTQENGRFAMDFLQRDLRMAGHLGCVNDQARFLPENDQGARSALTSTFLTQTEQMANDYNGASNDVPLALRFDIAVQGYEASGSDKGDEVTITATPTIEDNEGDWSPALPPELDAALTNRVKGSDILVLRYFAPTGAQVTAFTPNDPTATITVDPTQWLRLTEGVTNPGLFGVADCMNAGLFNATTLTEATGIITVGTSGMNKSTFSGLTSFVPGQAVVYRAETVVFYVGRSGTGQPVLYRARFNLAPNSAASTAPTVVREELVEGVESLQLRYAQDTRTDPAQRPTGNMATARTADDVLPSTDPTTAWRRVGLVQLGLLARSPDSAATMPRADGTTKYSALQTTFAVPDDKRHRGVYEASIALRNRLFGN